MGSYITYKLTTSRSSDFPESWWHGEKLLGNQQRHCTEVRNCYSRSIRIFSSIRNPQTWKVYSPPYLTLSNKRIDLFPLRCLRFLLPLCFLPIRWKKWKWMSRQHWRKEDWTFSFCKSGKPGFSLNRLQFSLLAKMLSVLVSVSYSP